MKRWECCFLCTNKHTIKYSNALWEPIIDTIRLAHAFRVDSLPHADAFICFSIFDSFSFQLENNGIVVASKHFEQINSRTAKNRHENPSWTRQMRRECGTATSCHRLVFPLFGQCQSKSGSDDWINYCDGWVKWTSNNKHQFHITCVCCLR